MSFIKQLFGRDFMSIADRIAADAEHADASALAGLAARLSKLDPLVVPRLTQFLDHSSPQVRHVAVVALGELLDTGTLGAVSRMTSDPDQGVRDAAQTAVARLQGELAQQHVKLRAAALAEGAYRCDVCHLSSDEVFAELKARHYARYGPNGPGFVQIGTLVGVCPKCRKAFCSRHCIAANPHDFFDNPKCPRDHSDLDDHWANACTPEQPWRLGPILKDHTKHSAEEPGRIAVGACGGCGKPVRIKAHAVKPGLKLTCRCGHLNIMGADSTLTSDAQREET